MMNNVRLTSCLFCFLTSSHLERIWNWIVAAIYNFMFTTYLMFWQIFETLQHDKFTIGDTCTPGYEVFTILSLELVGRILCIYAISILFVLQFLWHIYILPLSGTTAWVTPRSAKKMRISLTKQESFLAIECRFLTLCFVPNYLGSLSIREV